MSRGVFVIFAIIATLLGVQAQGFNRARLPGAPPPLAAAPAPAVPPPFVDPNSLLYYTSPPPSPASGLNELLAIVELARSLRPAPRAPRARLNSEQVVQKLINALVATTLRQDGALPEGL